MEKLILNVESKDQIIAYRDEIRLSHYELAIFAEILAAAESGDAETKKWFGNFGDSFRSIIMNVHAYRKGLEFGFTEIAFDQYGWFSRPQFLAVEKLIFGNEKRYGEHSTLKIGKGIGNVWTNALSYSFGTAGGGCGLSVYGKQFKSRGAAVDAGILELKTMMTAKVGDSDQSNYNPQVIRGTLSAIAKYEVESVQLTLF
ncbi:hypothetical protein SAMN05428975_1363 [Mucilaginibacter sp. OK268]|uniref:hypothetical protein n=1 Tax=Mucilaginibacter sp. OK268 TaxID=1881048 RepID=UPI00088BB376|nr:hypothetical protein [Mucilaginibacter sp. OK268]SDP47417.1 hypothetical protein SAMN05428975_1363 [Mucilaginibacter sp. OK268]